MFLDRNKIKFFKQNQFQSLKCEKSHPKYISKQQCLASYLNSNNFSPCPMKCIPVRMKGFKYVNDSAQLPICTKLTDEICNGGPLAWANLTTGFKKCPRPCKVTSYIFSQVEGYESGYMEENSDYVYMSMKPNRIKRIVNEILVYDVTDMIGALGGSLGLFLGFSCFGLISTCIDNLIDYLSKRLQF